MKTYKVKNYKGNLVESLKRFSDSHKGMKIVEACEDGDDLKIKAEESKQKIEEAVNDVYWAVVCYADNEMTIGGIFETNDEAYKAIKKLSDKAKNNSNLSFEYFPVNFGSLTKLRSDGFEPAHDPWAD